MSPENRSSRVAVVGLQETLRALDQMDMRTRKSVRRELYLAAKEVRDLAPEYVNPAGLSGWGKWRGGYDPSVIKAGIRLTRIVNKAGGYNTRNFIGIVNSSVAGAIWEVAGRRRKGRLPRKGRQETERVWGFSERSGRYRWTNQATGRLRQGGWGNGRAFVAGITGKDPGGPASRIVWRAYDRTDAGFVKRRIERMLIDEGKTTQRRIDMNPY